MPELLYLDTARVGQISPSANRALQDYFRLNSESHFPLYFDDIFSESMHVPDSILAEYRGLNCWRGISHLRNNIRRQLGADSMANVWFSARSAKLMEFASGLLFRRCRNVLITDLTWPRYEAILKTAIPNPSCRITKINISKQICGGIVPHQLIDFLSESFVANACDGLFVPLVSNLGIHLPVMKLVQNIHELTPLRFACVDIAQAINHVPIEADSHYFDFAIGGSHKWLRSHIPLGIGLSGNPRTRDFIERTAIRWVTRKLVDDPLFEFTTKKNRIRNSEYGETINPTPLIACAGALSDSASSHSAGGFPSNQFVREHFARIFGRYGMAVEDTDPQLWSNILVFRSNASSSNNATRRLHRKLLRFGIVTSLVDNILRISIPPGGLSDSQLALIESGAL